MPNVFKYTTGAAPASTLKKGNFYIGNNVADYGTTFYTGISPASGGYTIYLNKASGGPSMYVVANDSQLISFTNHIAGTNYTTINQCFNYFAGQSDKMVVQRDYEGIVTNGLVLNLDAGYLPSYPQNGTSWYDLSTTDNVGALLNGTTFNSVSGGTIEFDGTDDWITLNTGNTFAYGTNDFSLDCWFYDTSSTSIPYSVLYAQTIGGINYFIVGVGSNQVAWTGTLSGGGTAISGGGTYSRNTWNHVAVSRISGTVTVYLNTVPGTPTVNTTNFTNTSYVPTIGDESHHGSNYSWKGYIPILRIYKGKGLTANEVTQNYNAQKSRFGL